MKLSFSKRDTIILAVGLLLLIVLFVYSQFFTLAPLKTELASKQKDLQLEQDLLSAGTHKKPENISQTVEDSRELQKKIPVKPLEDQFILNLEKAENISNSQIKSMAFSKDADVTADSNDPNAETNGEQNGTSPNQNNSNNQAAIPVNGMKKLTVSLSVESPNYEALEKFIHSLETLQRIVVVESFAYSGGEEITSLSQDIQPLTYSLSISAYYMPELSDLVAQLPKIDVPKPAGKTNPLSQFSDGSTP